ncbi:MAG: type II CAAX endopeptidase family protein [Candidatus Acidiferrum sp.]
MQEIQPDQVPPESAVVSTPPVSTNWTIGKSGLRAGWRLAFYLLIVISLAVAISIGIRLLHQAAGRPAPSGPLSALQLLEQEILSFALVFGVALLMARIEHRPVGEYGLPGSGFLGRKFWIGFVAGLVEVCLLVGLISVFGGYTFGSLALSARGILGWSAFHLLLFFFVGLFEEFLFRGYTQFTLADGIGFWPAAILLSVGFGAVHLGNPGEGPVGAASVVLVALLFCFSLRRTGNLWFAVGLHASFDWGETFLFSTPNSGLIMQGHLSNSLLHGPRWLTGGTIGPEGSVFCFLTMGLQFLVVALLFPANKRIDQQAENLLVS